MRKFFRQTYAGKAFFILEKTDRVKLIVITFIQIGIGFLDLFGVVAIGALGALSIQGIESHSAGNKVTSFLRLLHIEGFSFQSRVAFLGISAGIILVIKTAVSVFFTRKIFFFLSNKSAQISANLISRVLSQRLLDMQERSSQEILFIVSTGVTTVLTGLLATSITLIADISLMIILTVGLFAVDSTVAISTTILFAATGYLLHSLLQVRAKEIGTAINRLTVKSNEKILEVLETYRETIVRDRQGYYANEIRKIKYDLGNITAEANFQPYIGKYVIELVGVFGALGLAGYEFGTKNAVHAIAILGVFLAASSRIAPAALRIQQGILGIKNSSGVARGTFKLIDDLSRQKVENSNTGIHEPDFDYKGFNPEIIVKGISFQYPKRDTFALTDVNFAIKAGTSIAFVGPSGAGKTTLLDLILGILSPNAGLIQLSGIQPIQASQRWPGSISYVPQNIVIVSGTIRENVALGYDLNFAKDERIWHALKLAKLDSFVSSLEHGIDTLVGENGAKISGGQRQRLGIARALFTNPKLLVLDEATSSLDVKTESEITSAISSLSGRVTVVIVAHRLSTVRAVDQLIYLKDGGVIACGSFDMVKTKVPEFAEQASLMGM